MESYEVVGLAAILDENENPYIFHAKVGPCSQNQAVVAAYGIAGGEKIPGVAQFRLLKEGWTASDVAAGIVIHKTNVPVCDECWNEKTKEKSQTHHWAKDPVTERCSICGAASSAWPDPRTTRTHTLPRRSVIDIYSYNLSGSPRLCSRTKWLFD